MFGRSSQEPEFFEGKGLYDFRARIVGGCIIYERRPRAQCLPQTWRRITATIAPPQLVTCALARFRGLSRSTEPVEAGVLAELKDSRSRE